MNEHNQFYTSISKYYSEIFPYKPLQLKFVRENLLDLPGKRILDIGCATGELAFQLAMSGASIVGIDLNKDLLKQANQKKKHSGLTFQAGNMLELKADFKCWEFDAVLCFGNTLVHLESLELVKKMLEEAIYVLKPGGNLFIQILNYDYILNDLVTELPIIETDKIKFTRKYKFPENSSVIEFITHLEIKQENKTVSNKTFLLALRSDELMHLLKDVGFGNIHFYSNFNQEAFGGKHLPLVLKCEKQRMG